MKQDFNRLQYEKEDDTKEVNDELSVTSFRKVKTMNLDWSPVGHKESLQYNYQFRKAFVTAVTTSHGHKARIETIYDTWGQDVDGVLFFMGTEEKVDNLGLEGIPVVQLPELSDHKDETRGTYEVLKYLYEHELNSYHWFVLVSDEVYINALGLEELLNRMDSESNIYMGYPSTNDFNDITYCAEGPGVILSRAALQELVQKLDQCKDEGNNWDIELGICVNNILNAKCANGAAEVRVLSNY